MGRLSDERWKAHQKVHEAEGRERLEAYRELQRRLAELNHAHQLQQQERVDFVRSDTYSAGQESMTEKIELNSLGLTELRASGGGIDKQKQSNQASWAIAISAAVAVVTVLAFIVLVATHHA